MKSTETFKSIIQAKLNEMAASDSLFAASLTKENKNIDECINYILATVKNSGCNGFSDDEIFGMAAHYYDEDDIKNVSKINCSVVVNRTVELTEEELKEARNKAIEQAIAKERDKFTAKPVVKKVDQAPTQQPTLF